jgi:hypothetical protein
LSRKFLNEPSMKTLTEIAYLQLLTAFVLEIRL